MEEEKVRHHIGWVEFALSGGVPAEAPPPGIATLPPGITHALDGMALHAQRSSGGQRARPPLRPPTTKIFRRQSRTCLQLFMMLKSGRGHCTSTLHEIQNNERFIKWRTPRVPERCPTSRTLRRYITPLMHRCCNSKDHHPFCFSRSEACGQNVRRMLTKHNLLQREYHDRALRGRATISLTRSGQRSSWEPTSAEGSSDGMMVHKSRR